MSYAPPTSSLEPGWAGEPNYRAPHANLPASWNSAQHYVGPAGVASHAELPPPSFTWDQFIAAQGFGDSVAAFRAWALRQNTYRDPQHTVSASWVGAEGYGPPFYTFTATWAAITYIAATGIHEEGVGDPVLIQTQFAAPDGWSSSGFGDAWAIYPWEYAPPEWVLDVSWVGRPAYHGKDSQVEGHWTLPSESKAVPLVGWDSLVVSDGLNLKHSLEYLEPTGFNAALFGVAYLANKAAPLRPTGLAAGAYGRPEVWNWRTYRAIPGFNAQTFGEHFVGGGVKEVMPGGIAAATLSKPTVINTKADQTAKPSAIAAPSVPAPNVSPRTVFPYGLGAWKFGTALVQRNPAPTGFYTARYGTPTIEYRTKYLTPPSVEPFELGFPRVFDPTRKVYPPSAAQVGIFGDTRLANRSYVVRPTGVDHLEIPIWTYLENTRRHIPAVSWNSASLGALAIANKSPSIAPPGLDALAPPVGVGVGYSIRYITPAGINSMRVGAPLLTKTPELSPKGFAGAAGSPTVWPRIRTVEAQGHDSQRLGGLSIWFRYRFISLEGFAADAYGKARAEHGRRTLLGIGAQHAIYGTPAVTNADRTVAPKSIFENFATGHMVGGLRFLRPVGFDAARFGSRIIPEIQQVYPLGFSGLCGLPLIFNFRKVITPTSITTGVQPADRWGTARAWNLRQYVVMSYDTDSALNPPAWPRWTKIENRTREIRISGHLSSRIGDHQADNAARPLYTEGIAAPATPASYEAGMVAFRVRPFRLEGIEPPYLSTWASVRNAAAVLKPFGSVATLWGVPAVENTRRAFERIGGFDSAWYGYPMVAERVRTLSFEGRYTIGAPAIPLPEVKLHTRYVDGIGYDASGIGWASLSIHWTLITPRWTLQNLYGIPAVRNVTPELRTRGRASDEFGDAFVRLEWRPVAPDGALTQLFGKTIIAFRDRTVSVAGLRAWAFGDKLTVVKTGAPPYSMQTINLDAEYFNNEVAKEGQGIPPPEKQVPRPIINQQGVYVRQQDPATRYGNHRVTANSIRVEPGIGEHLIDEPFVALKVRTLIVGGVSDEEVFDPEKPRLSPHTIYAVVEAPAQAMLNHPRPPLGLHYVDGYRRQPGALFGNAAVTLQRRVINARYFASQWILPGYGRPTLQLKLHYITPTGFTTFRAGWHTVPGTGILEQFDSEDAALYGEPSIDHVIPVGPRTVAAPGLDALDVGEQQIELLNRVVSAQGYEATRMGAAKPGDTPYMWQGLRVGPLMPTIPEGFGADLHGGQWISHRVREVHPAGFDGFQSEYQLEAFEQRMRVTRRAPSATIAARSLLAAGAHPDSVLGTPDVRPGVHFIRPDGNAEQFRKGAF